MNFGKCKNKLCKTCFVASVGADCSNDTPFCKVRNVIYKINCTVCDQCYIGQTGGELHMRINVHRNKANNSSTHDTLELKHFRKHGFENITISIIDIIENLNDRLKEENYNIFKHNTFYPYGLNTKLNFIDAHCIDNIFNCFRVFGSKRKINRGHRGSHRFSKFINDIIPPIRLKNLETDFIRNLSIKYVKTAFF